MKKSTPFLSIGVAFLLIVAPRIAVSQSVGNLQEGQPNILFIGIEDMSPYLGSYGYDFMHTPNMDSLARHGVRFSRAYVQAPVCAPSRASIMSGLRPQTTGVYSNFTNWRSRIPSEWPTLPEYFRAHGYDAIKVGKIFDRRSYPDAMGATTRRDKDIWTRVLDDNVDGQDYAIPPRKPDKPAPGRLPDGRETHEYAIKSLSWGPSGLDPFEQRDGARVRVAADLFRQDRETPFLLGVGLSAPHYPLRAPKQFHDLYSPDEIELSKSPADDLDDIPVEYPPFNLTDEYYFGSVDERRELVASYYSTISYIDYLVGYLVERLRRSQYADNTVIVIWSDHGMHMGEHNLWRKMTLFEEAAHVPLIIAAPGVQGGKESSRLVELVDLYPTLVELTGLPRPHGLEGTSLVPLLHRPDRPWKQAAFTVREKGNVSIRTERWRYTEWGSRELAELYDHRNDAGEQQNLANDSSYADVVDKLHELLKAGWYAAQPGWGSVPKHTITHE